MCGIFGALLDPSSSADTAGLLAALARTSHRGPDNARLEHITGNARSPRLVFGFHRLRINGLNRESDQPLHVAHVSLVCNGEIYNARELAASDPALACETDSDCEIIARLYLQRGLDAALEALDGVFAFLLYDHDLGRLYAARDLLGIRPLFVGTSPQGLCAWASEAKSLLHCRDVAQFAPGTWEAWSVKAGEETGVSAAGRGRFWTDIPLSPMLRELPKDHLAQLRELLHAAVRKRLTLSDRPVGCLLSGGLDSTLVTAIVVRERKRLTPDAAPVKTYSIGMAGSPDLQWARRAAEHLGTDHHEVLLTEEEFLAAVRDTVWHTESYDTTTVRASVGNLLVSRYVRDHSDDTVLFVGDVADELFGSYRGFCKAPDADAFDRANRRMLFNIHRFDVLRSDRTISGAGLEARVPFGDKAFLRYVLSLPGASKMFGGERMEKMLLREAFEGYLPRELLYRRKEAFSDGVAGLERGWHEVLQERAAREVADDELEREPSVPDKETCWYLRLYRACGFEACCGAGRPPFGADGFWRHPFCDADADPSARLLDCY